MKKYIVITMQLSFILPLCLLFSCVPSAEEKADRPKQIQDSIHVAIETEKIVEGAEYQQVMKDTSRVETGLGVVPSNTVAIDQYVKEQSKKVQGKLHYNIPSQMQIDTDYAVWVTIKQNTNLSEKPAIAKPNEEIHASKLEEVLPEMQINLDDGSSGADDKNFEIKSLNPFPLQHVNNIEFTTWEFNIKPIKPGKHILKIILSGCLAKKKDGCKSVQLEEINVEIESTYFRPMKLFWVKNWQILLTAIFIPLIVWLFNTWRKNN